MSSSTSPKRTVFSLLFALLMITLGSSQALALKNPPPTQKLMAIYYVNAASTAANPDGSSWSEAYADLQSAVDAAEASGGGEVWVAAGSYTSDDDAVLTMKEGVDLYGGFSGTESTREERNWQVNGTTINGEDEHSCVIGANEALLHGFTITRGYAELGGGMFNDNASPTISHCHFVENQSSSYGGALYNRSSSPRITHCSFVDNRATYWGGGLYNLSSFPVLTNCSLVQNEAARGAGLFNNYAGPTMINCTIVNNVADDSSGGMVTMGSTPTVTNCIFWGNVKAQISGPANVCYSCIQGGHGGTGNIDADPLFLSVPFSIQLLPGSPCIDSGTDQYVPDTDILDRPRPQGEGIDMGAYEGAVFPDDQCILTIVTEPAHIGKTIPSQGSYLFARGDTVRLQVVNMGGAFTHWSGDMTGNTAAATLVMDADKNLTAHFQQHIFHVDGGSTASNPDGSSWSEAYADLQSAVDAAEAAGGGELWVAAGRYTSTNYEVLTMKEEVALFGGFAGTETHFEERNWEAWPTLIDGEEQRQCVIGADRSIIDGFIITRGQGSYSGGIHLEKASPVIENCSFVKNKASYGGAALYNDASSPTIINCRFMENESTFGGAIFNYSSQPTMTQCSFVMNHATQGGGALYNTSSAVVMTRCSFIKNKNLVTGGGAIFNSYTKLTATNCSFVENDAPYGAGMYNEFASSSTVMNCSFVDNHGDGIHNQLDTPSMVTNTILWGNGEEQIVGPATVTYSCVEEGYGGEGNIDTDPGFLSAPYSIQLLPGSPCINTGTTEKAPDSDILGRPRPQGTGIDMGAYEGAVLPADQCTLTVLAEPADLGNTIPPAGTYLFAWGESATLRAQGYGGFFSHWSGDLAEADGETSLLMDGDKTVTAHFLENRFYVDVDGISVPQDGGFWATVSGDLQSAVNQAHAEGGGEIWVAAGNYTSLTYPVLTMKEGVTIYGGFSGKERSREARNWKRHLTVIDGEDEGPCVQGANHSRIDGFTLTRGHAVYGGAMGNDNASPTVANCNFVENNATEDGGAMMNLSASPIIINCNFVENTAAKSGGALDNYKASPILTNCNFVSNRAAEFGGALFNHQDSAPEIMNCAFVQNTAQVDGGAVFNEECTFRATNAIFWENSQDQIVNFITDEISITHSCVQGGYEGVNNMDEDPLFVEAPHNLKLPPDSPCIDAGTSSGAPDTDILGRPRPQNAGIDMGAYEYHPGDEDDEEPVEGEYVEPAEGEYVEPIEGEDVEPTEGEHVEPIEGEHVEPIEGEDVEPIEGEDVESAEGEDMEPTEGEAVEPAEGEAVEPIEGEDVEPVEGESVEPAEGEHVEPTEGEDVEPVEGESVEPAEGEHVEPTEGEGVEPAEGEDVEPVEGEQADDDTSGCGCGGNKTFRDKAFFFDNLQHLLSDLLLLGVSVLVLASFSTCRRY